MKLRYMLTCLLTVVSLTEAAPKPNIIFILADDFGWADTSYNPGAAPYLTPEIDKMVDSGLKLNRFYPGAANCSPSRSCLMTGTYTPRTTIYTPAGGSKGTTDSIVYWDVSSKGENPQIKTTNQLDPSFESVAEVLNKAGYTTGHFGKWHLGEDTQGFDSFTLNGRTFENNGKKYYNDVDVAYDMADAVCEFIDKNQDGPFYAYLAHWDVHGPIKARKDVIAKHRDRIENHPDKGRKWNATYQAMIEAVDMSVKQVRAKLRDLGIEKNTVLIFATDNGSTPAVTLSAPLKGAKGSFYEGGIRTPGVVEWPGTITSGTETDQAFTGVDLLPTLADLAGAPLPVTQPVDGRSYVPALLGNTMPERDIFWFYPFYMSGVAHGQVHPIKGTDKMYWRAVPMCAISRGPWKLLHLYEYGTDELYNVVDDMGEEHNLIGTHPDIAKALKASLMAWIDDVDAPAPKVRNPKFNPDAEPPQKERKGRRKQK